MASGVIDLAVADTENLGNKALMERKRDEHNLGACFDAWPYPGRRVVELIRLPAWGCLSMFFSTCNCHMCLQYPS